MRKPPTKIDSEDLVRVLAVRRPPTESVSATVLAETDPYVTDASVAALLGVADEADDSREADAQLAALGEKVLAALTSPAITDVDRAAFWAISLSQPCEDLYRGAYTPTERNPIYALQAFVTFYQVGLYPPAWVLDLLNQAFNSFLKSEGEQSLDSLLSAKRGKGQTPIFREAHAVDAESAAMQEIALLNAAGVSVAHAAAMVAGRFERLAVKCPSADTLAERFTKRGWRHVSNPMRQAGAIPEAEKKAAFAATYPAHTIPDRWK